MIYKISIPIKIALYSFVIGTLLFTANFLFPNQFYIIISGLFFILLALLVNFIVLIYLIKKVLLSPVTNPKNTEELLAILANIPVTALYIFIIFNQNSF